MTAASALVPLWNRQAEWQRRLAMIADAQKFATGAGVTVAVIDTGVNGSPRVPAEPGGDFVDAGGNGMSDCDAHGTLTASIIAGHLQAMPPRPSTLRPGISGDVDAVFGRALAKEPDRRYGSCRDFAVTSNARSPFLSCPRSRRCARRRPRGGSAPRGRGVLRLRPDPRQRRDHLLRRGEPGVEAAP